MPTSESVASQALNGAQVASLIQITNAVASGSVSREGAVTMITAAFPLISAEEADRIIAGVNVGVIAPQTKTPEVTQDSPAAEPALSEPVAEKKRRARK